ncbi:MAG TPA: hypothetical protein VJK71_10330 [Gemmatimonadales bacterium]|nr:hypothetical protein [Gemmatimonadales bacterium]
MTRNPSPDLAAGATAELGPLLGRLASPPDHPSPGESLLSRVRLDLLTGIFERAGWLAVWERAVASAEQTISGEIEVRLRDAARASRYPARRLREELPTAEDRELFGARLSAAGIGYEDAVARLEQGRAVIDEQLRRMCGELEAGWERLVATADQELARGDLRSARIHAWRRPWSPLLIGGGTLVGMAIWLGLVLGGYLDSPSWLRPLADWFWSR